MRWEGGREEGESGDGRVTGAGKGCWPIHGRSVALRVAASLESTKTRYGLTHSQMYRETPRAKLGEDHGYPLSPDT